MGDFYEDCIGAKASPDLSPRGQAKDRILSIEFAPNGERSRKVVGRSNSRPTGRYPSYRMKRMIEWDSPYELYAYRLLDVDPGVLEYREQPCVIHYCLNGQNQRHYPDSLVTTKNGKTLLEVKTTRDACRPEISNRTGFLIQKLPAYGYQYQIVIAEELQKEPRQRNCRLVLKLGRRALTFEQREFARRLFEVKPCLEWSDLKNGRYAPIGIEDCCRLMLEGVLKLNLDDPISEETSFVKAKPDELLGCSIV